MDQTIIVNVQNHSQENISFRLETTKQYEDLPADFIGNGSVFKDTIVFAESEVDVQPKVFAQIAENTEYTIPFKAVSDEKVIGEGSVSFSADAVDMSAGSIEHMGTDVSTLTKTYLIINDGDKFTNLVSDVASEDCAFYSQPAVVCHAKRKKLTSKIPKNSRRF